MTPGLVAVFADAHAHAEALDAVIAAADASGAEALWSLGDMVGAGPDPDHVVARTRERCSVALMGNHDYGATGSAEPTRFGEPGSPAARSIELARERLDDDAIAWMRKLRPAARRGDVQCWHGGPHNPVHEYVGKSNAAACLSRPDERARPRRPHARRRRPCCRRPAAPGACRIRVGEPLDLAGGKWLLNPGAVGAPAPAAPRLVGRPRRRGRRGRLLAAARPRAAHRDVAPRAVRPGPARRRARELGLES